MLLSEVMKYLVSEVVVSFMVIVLFTAPIADNPDHRSHPYNQSMFVSRYFIDHPDMLLGKMAWHDNMYGNQKETACLPIEGAELADQLASAMQHITGQITEAELPDLGEGEVINTSIPADPDVRNFSYAIVNSEVYYRENSRMVKPELNATAKERVKGLVELRDCVRELIEQQMDNAPDEIIQRTQAQLNALYDDFMAKYGLINSRGNANAFSKMQQLGTRNMSAYLRKIAIDGYVVKLELPELKEMISLLRRSSNNLNQLAKRANETGRVYDADVEDVLQNQERLWQAANAILTKMAAIK